MQRNRGDLMCMSHDFLAGSEYTSKSFLGIMKAMLKCTWYAASEKSPDMVCSTALNISFAPAEDDLEIWDEVLLKACFTASFKSEPDLWRLAVCRISDWESPCNSLNSQWEIWRQVHIVSRPRRMDLMPWRGTEYFILKRFGWTTFLKQFSLLHTTFKV